MAAETTITFDETEIAWARQLVEEGAYASIEEAVRGELAEMRDLRAQHHHLMVEEVKRRLELPDDQWVRVESDTYFADRFRAKHDLGETDT